VFSEGNRLYSYGHHFELGRIIDSEDESNGIRLAILNGDRYSVTTSKHQAGTRRAIADAGIPSIILPFSAVDRAGIMLDTIRPHEIQDDAWRTVQRSSSNLEDVPAYKRTTYVRAADGTMIEHDVQPDDDGLYRWETSEHQLGASVFSAEVQAERIIGTCEGGYDGKPDHCPPEVGYMRTRHPHEITERYTERRWYVSGFDDQERNPLYFLAELPGRAFSYEAALKMLRPMAVKMADRACQPVTRQGDIFGIPSPFTLRQLRKRGATVEKRRHLDGTSHTGSEVAVLPNGVEYARGMLRHEPAGFRRPEHARRKIGDGKTWHVIVRNTVPQDAHGNPRAWTISGRVD